MPFIIKGGMEALAEKYFRHLLSGKPLEAYNVPPDQVEFILLFEKHAQTMTATQIEFHTHGYMLAGQAYVLASAKDFANRLLKSVGKGHLVSNELEKKLLKYPELYPHTFAAKKGEPCPFWIVFVWKQKGLPHEKILECGASQSQLKKINEIKKYTHNYTFPITLAHALHIDKYNCRKIQKFLDEEKRKASKMNKIAEEHALKIKQNF